MSDDVLLHFGVKGMKWGVRKDNKTPSTSKRAREEYYNRARVNLTFTSKNGQKVNLVETNNSKIGVILDSYSKSGRTSLKEDKTMSVSVDGKKVGDVSLVARANKDLYVNWIGIDPKHRGQGYASAVFASVMEYGRSIGAKKATLEVPGNAPDARHIYEKHGFKVVKEPSPDEIENDYVWGGLTDMEYTYDDLRHEASEEDLELERAIMNTFPDLESELLHFGVKGMKWGVRRKDGSDGRVTGSSHGTRGISNLSDAELRDKINRMRLEQEYARLNPSAIRRGSAGVSKLLTNVATNVANQQLSKYANRGIDTAIDAIFGEGTANPKKKKK